MKRTLSVILVFLMLISVVPTSAFALEADIADTAADADAADTGATTISTANIVATEPYAGKHPNYNVSPGNSTFSIASVKWTSWETGSSVVMSSSDIFRAGFNYTLTLEITANSGYQFAISGSYSAVTAKINGSEASTYTVSGLSAANRIKVVKTFGPVADTGLKSVQASIAKPFPEQYPSFSAWIPDTNAGYEVEDYDATTYKDGVNWYDDTAGSFISPSNPVKFIGGHQYTVTISLVPKTGYSFYKTTSSISGKINGNTATVGDYNNSDYADRNISLKYRFACENSKIYSIDVKVTAPVADQTPSFSAIETSAQYDVNTSLNTTVYKNGVEWYDLTAGSAVAINGSVKFIAGHKYRVSVFVKANQGYEFPTTAVTGLVNNNNGNVVAMYGYDKALYRTVECEFIATSPVPSVEVTGVTAPLPDAKPVYAAAVTSGQGYQVETTWNSGDSIKNGVKWYNVTDNEDVKETDTFVLGKRYKVTVSLITTDGYSFINSTTATLNYENAVVSREWMHPDKNIAVVYTFTCKNTSTISSVAITGVTAPASGETPSYTAAAATAGVRIETEWDNDFNNVKDGMYWTDVATGTRMKFTDKFSKGRQYSVRISLKHKDYYKFNGTISATVNGNTASKTGNYTLGENPWVEYTFTCGENVSQQVNVIVTSYLNGSDKLNVSLMGITNGKIYSNNSVKGTIGASGPATVTFDSVAPGMYSVSIGKKNHVTRTITIVVNSAPCVVDDKICPIGDADNNGRVNAADAKAAFQHSNEQKLIEDDYKLKCADVANPKNIINSADAKAIFQHSNEQKSLWTD